MSTDDLLLMDNLLEWLALGFWTTLMDVLEMVRFFIVPHQLPPCPRIIQSAAITLVKFKLFQIMPHFVISLVNSSRPFHFSKKVPRVTSWMARVVSLTSPLGPINMCILSLILYLSHNFSFAISSKSLV